MYLDFWLDQGSFACITTPLLSKYSGISDTIDGTTQSFIANFLIQTTSFAAFDIAIYLASVVESAVVDCLELF